MSKGQRIVGYVALVLFVFFALLTLAAMRQGTFPFPHKMGFVVVVALCIAALGWVMAFRSVRGKRLAWLPTAAFGSLSFQALLVGALIVALLWGLAAYGWYLVARSPET